MGERAGVAGESAAKFAAVAVGEPASLIADLAGLVGSAHASFLNVPLRSWCTLPAGEFVFVASPRGVRRR